MNLKTITIFTPVYNRKKEIIHLYESLVRQTNKDFIWIVVDDGSTDNVFNILNKWKNENKIQMLIIRQENGGKHRAHNKGVQLCNTPWFICVDSDDYLADNAVEIMHSEISTLDDNDIGVIFAKFKLNVGMPNRWFNNGEKVNVSDIALRFGHIIETALLFRTNLLKTNLFPEIDGERFLGEEILYNKLQQFGRMKASDKVIYFFSYLENGLTNHTFYVWKNNPQGVLLVLCSRYETLKKADARLLAKGKALIKCIMNINAICLATGKSIGKFSPNKAMSFILFFPSLIFKEIRYGKN